MYCLLVSLVRAPLCVMSEALWMGGKGGEGNACGTGGVSVSCGLAVPSVRSLDTSAFAKVGAMVPSWSARAISSSCWEDLSDVLVSGFIGGWDEGVFLG